MLSFPTCQVKTCTKWREKYELCTLNNLNLRADLKSRYPFFCFFCYFVKKILMHATVLGQLFKLGDVNKLIPMMQSFTVHYHHASVWSYKNFTSFLLSVYSQDLFYHTHLTHILKTHSILPSQPSQLYAMAMKLMPLPAQGLDCLYLVAVAFTSQLSTLKACIVGANIIPHKH